MIDAMLQCHSFIVQMFELLILIGKDIEERKVNKKSSTARLIIFVEDSVDSRPFVNQFGFCRILFYFKRKKYVCVNFVLLFVLLFTIIQSILAVARGP